MNNSSVDPFDYDETIISIPSLSLGDRIFVFKPDEDTGRRQVRWFPFSFSVYGRTHYLFRVKRLKQPS